MLKKGKTNIFFDRNKKDIRFKNSDFFVYIKDNEFNIANPSTVYNAILNNDDYYLTPDKC